MLTQSKAKLTAEELQALKIEVGARKTYSRVEMSETREDGGTPSISKKDFFEAFMTMKSMVEELYTERRERTKGASLVKTEEGEGAGGGGDPPDSSNPTDSPLSPHNSSDDHKEKNTNSFRKPLLKLDVKFDLPMFNGESNADKLNNWI